MLLSSEKWGRQLSSEDPYLGTFNVYVCVSVYIHTCMQDK